jgi:hypothetical protein
VSDLQVRHQLFQILATDKYAPAASLSHISVSAVRRLRALQHLNIHLDSPLAPSTGRTDTLASATKFMESVLSTLPCPSLVKSLSLRINDRTGLNSGVDAYRSIFHDLLTCVYEQVSFPDQWPCLSSINILINVNDAYFTGTLRKRNKIVFRAMELVIIAHLHVNLVGAEDFGGSTRELMSGARSCHEGLTHVNL